MKNRVVLLCLALIATVTGGRTYAQNYVYATGNPRFSTQIPIENGFINVNNGEIHLEIPLSTLQQRGHLQLNEELVYDSRIWQDVNSSWQPTNVPNSMGGWRFTTNTQSSTPTYSANPTQWGSCGQGQEQYPTEETINNFAWTDPQGTPHVFNISFSQYLPIPCDQNVQANGASGHAVDGSGYLLSATYDLNWGGVDFVVYDASGNEIYPTVEDPNGNYFSSDSNGNLVDTLGRTPVKTTTNGNQITYNVLGWQGNYYPYTVTTETVYYHTAFNQLINPSGSFTAIQSIKLPDGTSYQFTYDSGTASGNYGELTSMTLPSGAEIQFTWQNFVDSFDNDNRWIASANGGPGGTKTFQPSVYSYCSEGYGCEEATDVTDASANDTVYTFVLDPGTITNASSWISSVFAYQGSQYQGPILEYSRMSYTSNPVTVGSATYDVPQSQTVTVTYTDGETAQTVTTLDSTGTLPTSVQNWDYFYPSPPATPTVQTTYTYGEYVNGAGFPTAIQMTDSSGDLISKTTYGYDQKGNITSASQWVNSTGSTTVNTTATYDNAGTMLTKTDPNGTATFGHDNTDTFVTSITPPTPSSGVSLTWYAQYDFSSGLLENTTDPNGQETIYKSYDAYGRAGEIDYPDYGKTVYTYTPNHAYMPTQLSIYQYQNASTYADSETLFDGYGRAVRTAAANGQSSNPWYEQDTCYNSVGQIGFQSYRYQAASLNGTEVCSGAGDTFSYEGLGRVTKVAHGDGTQVVSSYYGRAQETTDENNVSRIVQVDAFGRTTAVCEISSTALQGASGAPTNCATDVGGTGYPTNYAYGYAGGVHQTTVTQGTQSRVFQTDLIGRTISQQEPESGTTTYSYAYNSTGMVVTRQKPQANQSSASVLTTTTTQHDSLGRVVSVNYNDGLTLGKTLYYDTSSGWGANFPQTYIKGRLSKAVSSGGWEASMFSYDPMGRTILIGECTPAFCTSSPPAHALNYTYDLAGNLLTSTDSGGVTTTYTVSPANEEQTVTSSQDGALISSGKFGPFGAASWTLGNRRSGSYSYDSLGRLSGGTISGQNGPTYEFSATRTGQQLKNSWDTVMSGLGESFTYGYDALNHLISQTSPVRTIPSLSWTYDRWGNRWTQTVTAGSGPQPSLSFSAASNQITNSGYTYDAAGNQTSDGTHHYTYDAEGNILQVDNGSTATYIYDTLNHRVETTASGATTDYVFNAAGQMASEWSASTHAELKGHYYWGAAPLAFYTTAASDDINGPAVYYQHQDWEGTERMRTDLNGNQAASFTSLPFGDAQTETIIGATDLDASHFALLDFDTESGTDHAQFRQYSSTEGRWMGPDPYIGSYDFSNPQTLNRYAYVNGQPLAFSDSSGLDGGDGCVEWCGPGGGGDCGFLCGLLGGLPYFPEDGPPSPQRIDVPRPAANPWNDKFGVPYPGLTASIQQALGFPTAGCEFGACGAGPSSYDSSTGAALNPNNTLQYTIGSILELFGYGVAYANWGDPNERLFGTHYCGPGGGGSDVNQLDTFCHIHDDCYGKYGVNASANTASGGVQLTPFQIAGITGCNQALANGAKGLIGQVTGADYVYYWMTGSFGFLYPGTTAH